LSPLTDPLAPRLAIAVLIAFGGFCLEVRQAGSTTVASSYEAFAVAEVADGENTPVAQTTPTETTVYATRTGTKYHRAGCRHLSRSQIPMSLREAAERYGPCSVCKPPRPGQVSEAAPQALVAPPGQKPSSSTSAPRPSTSSPSVSAGRCQATTKKGTQCSRKAQPGRNYCWQH
jgi:hypothetical protein